VAPQAARPIKVFFSYSHKDEELRDQLATQLAMLRREEVIQDWHDRRIIGGQEWGGQIDAHLNSSDIILLLVSSDFLASEYCYDIEVKRAMERHEAEETRVIPIILRPCDWTRAPFAKLQALPKDVKPVTRWADRDEAFLDVATGIRKAAEEIRRVSTTTLAPVEEGTSTVLPSPIPDHLIVKFVTRYDRDGRNIVERLKEELAPQMKRLLVLWGAGGVGKSTIAAEAARSLSESFAGRILWISVDGRENFALSNLLDDIATQLGREDIRPLAVEPKKEQVRDVVVAAPALIVLDNFETIKPEEQQDCLEWLAQPAPCSVLITTRDKIEDRRNLPIATMSPEEARIFLEQLIVEAHDPEAFAEVDRERVIKTAEANPLLLRWVMAQIDLAQDPQEVLNDLSHGEGYAAQRVFDRSFNLPQVGDSGRRALLTLSLFVPSATRPALMDVAGFGKDRRQFNEVVRRLASLWLVRATDAGQRLRVEGLTRDMTSAHLLKEKRAKLFQQRFIARFLNYAQQHKQRTAEHLNALEEEKDNVLRAIDMAFELKESESVITIAHSITTFLDTRGYWDEAIQQYQRALKVAEAVHSEWYIGSFTDHLGQIFINRGDYFLARTNCEKAVEIARRIGQEQGLSASLGNLALAAHYQGEIEEAKQLHSESLEINKKLGNQRGAAAALHNLAVIAQGQGELGEARRLYGESLEINKKLGNPSGIAITLHELGRLAQDQGDLDEARRLLNESLEIKKRLGNPSGIAITLHQLAMLAQDQGDLDEARRLLNESLEIKKRLDDQSGIAATLHELGRLAQKQGDLEEARRLFNESLEIKKRLGNPSGIAITLHQLAMLAQDQGDLDEARRLYNESLEIAKRLGDQGGIASTLHQLGRLTEDEGDIEEAARLFRETLSIFEKLGSPNAEIARESLERIEGESS